MSASPTSLTNGSNGPDLLADDPLLQSAPTHEELPHAKITGLASDIDGQQARSIVRYAAAAGLTVGAYLLLRHAAGASNTRKARAGVKVVGGAYRVGRLRGRLSKTHTPEIPTPELHVASSVRAGLSSIDWNDFAVEHADGTLRVRSGKRVFSVDLPR